MQYIIRAIVVVQKNLFLCLAPGLSVIIREVGKKRKTINMDSDRTRGGLCDVLLSFSCVWMVFGLETRSETVGSSLAAPRLARSQSHLLAAHKPGRAAFQFE